MLLEQVVPGHLEIVGESAVVVRQPGHLVQQDHGAAAVVDLAVQPAECVEPVSGRGGFGVRLRRKTPTKRKKKVSPICDFAI